MKKQTSIAGKQYQKLENAYELDKIIEKEKPTVKKYNRSNIIYESKDNFYGYYNIKNFNSLFLESKYQILASSYNKLNKFNSLKPRKGCRKEESDCI